MSPLHSSRSNFATVGSRSAYGWIAGALAVQHLGDGQITHVLWAPKAELASVRMAQEMDLNSVDPNIGDEVGRSNAGRAIQI